MSTPLPSLAIQQLIENHSEEGWLHDYTNDLSVNTKVLDVVLVWLPGGICGDLTLGGPSRTASWATPTKSTMGEQVSVPLAGAWHLRGSHQPAERAVRNRAARIGEGRLPGLGGTWEVETTVEMPIWVSLAYLGSDSDGSSRLQHPIVPMGIS